jgi:hypothetical protein
MLLQADFKDRREDRCGGHCFAATHSAFRLAWRGAWAFGFHSRMLFILHEPLIFG